MGLEAELALVRVDGLVAEDVPSLDQFDHISLPGGRFIDPTVRETEIDRSADGLDSAPLPLEWERRQISATPFAKWEVKRLPGNAVRVFYERFAVRRDASAFGGSVSAHEPLRDALEQPLIFEPK